MAADSTRAGDPRRARGEIVVCVVGEGPATGLADVRARTPGPVDVLDCTGPRGAAEALDAAAEADVVLLSAGCRVPADWLQELAAGARDDAGVATASALAVPVDDGGNLAAARSAARAAIFGAGPDLEAPQGPCVYLSRGALELIGSADALDSAGRVRAAFAAACRRAGLRHALVPLVVAHPNHPAAPASGSVAAAVRRVRDGLRIAIDARMLTGIPDGTRVHVLELIAALAATGRCRVTALAGVRLDEAARARLQALDGVSVVTLADGASPPEPAFDLVHRPFQLSAPPDLAGLAGLAPRLVVTHQDLIAYRNAGYFASPAAWEQYRALTREALAVADHVVFFSEHARRDALGETLVEAGRASVVPIGVDHVFDRDADPAPAGTAAGLAGVPDDEDVLLCLGSDYLHKNRVFALRLVEALQREHGWAGRLVLAGPTMANGSSRGDEQAFLAARPSVRAAVVDLGAVDEPDKRRLLRRCALVLYPSVAEGFGLVPFEAAAYDRACLWAAGSSLREVLPGVDGAIVPWSATLTAQRTRALLDDPAARAASVAAVGRAAQALPWSRTAERLLEVYAAVCAAPPSQLGAAARAAGALGGVSADGMRLVGPHGAVPADLERPLLALFTRSWLARPVGSVLRATHNAARRRAG
jgi:glycosyltransferase involved in cell wall biosynthesis